MDDDSLGDRLVGSPATRRGNGKSHRYVGNEREPVRLSLKPRRCKPSARVLRPRGYSRHLRAVRTGRRELLAA